MSDKLKEFVRQSMDEMLRSLPAAERLKGLSIKERLAGLSAEELLKELSPEEVILALPPEVRERLAREPKTNGSSSQSQ